MKIFKLMVFLVSFTFFSILLTMPYLHGRTSNLKFSPGNNQTLLVMFTTVKEVGMIPHHQLAFNAVLSNWPSFKPYIQPVVFLNFTDSSLARDALEAGWEVLPLPRANPSGAAFLKDMYQTVFDKYDSMLYGFANGDLLFDDGLVETLKGVQKNLESLRNNVLVAGVRTNVDVILKNTFSLDEFRKDRLRKMVAKSGKLFRQDAIDYFFLTKGCSLEWSKLVDIVVGRPAYDTYLVAMAARHGVNVIDGTETILAVHISEKGVPSHGWLNHDAMFNGLLIGSNFRHQDGLASRTKFMCSKQFWGDVTIVKRKFKPSSQQFKHSSQQFRRPSQRVKHSFQQVKHSSLSHNKLMFSLTASLVAIIVVVFLILIVVTIINCNNNKCSWEARGKLKSRTLRMKPKRGLNKPFEEVWNTRL